MQALYGDADLAGDLLDVLLLGGQELVQRGIQEANDNRAALHGLVQALEVALLVGHDLGQCLFAVLGVVGDDHLAHGLDALALKEHMLGAAQPMPGRRKRGPGRRRGGVGVGVDR